MIETWIIISVLAAFSQNIRSTYQKKLKSKMSNISSTYTRFLFGFPFVFLYFYFLYNYTNSTFLIENININFLKKKYIYNLIICSFIKLQLKI